MLRLALLLGPAFPYSDDHLAVDLNLLHRPTSGLPARARVTEVLVDDGGEVDEGQPLLAIEAL